MLTFIVYSHTEYLDILKIQTDFLKDVQTKKLLINKNGLNLTEVYSKYQDVIFYDDSLPYASRLLELVSLSEEYFLFTHDIDILLKKDLNTLNNFVKIMSNNNIDRIDLQYYKFQTNQELIKIENFSPSSFLSRQIIPEHYIYNVNPSIWKKSVLLEIMSKFANDNYRTIEKMEVQRYCQKFNIFKLYSTEYKEVGYFHCIPVYEFLHISHGGHLLPIEDNGLDEIYSKVYSNICDKYLKNGNRKFRIARW